MKHLFLLVILVLVYFGNLSAQVHIPVGTAHEVEQFLGRTTCFVLKDELLSDYNEEIEQAVSEFWTITPFEIIDVSEFEENRLDDSYSFVVINQVYFEKDKSQTKFDFLIATLGGNYASINSMPSLCAVPICYKGAPEEDYAYKTSLLVRFIQSHIIVCSEHPDLNERSIVRFYNNQPDLLADKKLYVLREELDPSISQKTAFAKDYKGEFEIVDKETIELLIDNADPNAAILHLIKPRNSSGLDRCFKIVVGTGNARMYYYDMHPIKKNKGATLLKSDLKKM